MSNLGPRRVVLVPGVLALLPEYASLTDPVAQLRAACLTAVGWLGPDPEILADEQGGRIARALIDAAAVTAGPDPGVGTSPPAARTHLVVANGSGCRTPAAPGSFDEQAEAFDAELGAALLAPDPDALRRTDQALAARLWAHTAAVPRLADLLTGEESVAVDFAGAPFGVQYWVIRYERPRTRPGSRVRSAAPTRR